MSDQEYHHVVDQIKDDIKAIREAQGQQAAAQEVQAGVQQQLVSELADLRMRIVGNGNPEGSVCWDLAMIKQEIAPFDLGGQKKPLRQVVAECYSYVRGFKMTWSKAGGIIIFLMQGLMLAYMTGLLKLKP